MQNHPDHLGSSSYITNLAGEITQHTCSERSRRVEYLPFGETLIEEHLNSNNSPYRFNAKELDAETGNYYYGARYYDTKFSIWLSIDPLAEQMRRHAPYNYAFNNPVFFIDPDGMMPLATSIGMETGAVESVGGSHGFDVRTFDRETNETLGFASVSNKQGVNIHTDGTLEKNNLQTRGDVGNIEISDVSLEIGRASCRERV